MPNTTRIEFTKTFLEGSLEGITVPGYFDVPSHSTAAKYAEGLRQNHTHRDAQGVLCRWAAVRTISRA